MKEMFNNKRILIVAAHPDDELLGLGGTICRLKRKHKSHIGVLLLGEGITSRSNSRDTKKWEKEIIVHQKNILEAKKFLGYDDLFLHGFPDNRFDSVPLLDIIKVVEDTVLNFKPDIIFTHHEGDLNIDHQVTYKAVITSTRPFNNPSLNSIFTFETPSSTEWQFGLKQGSFKPNFFVEIKKEDLDNKIKAMECYKYEKRDFPHPRSSNSLTTLAKLRGIQNGKEFAEAFVLVRSNI